MSPARTAFAGLALAAAVSALPAAAVARDCSVDAAEGAEIRSWHNGAWSGLATGARIPPEAKVVTGPGSRVNISCDDGIVITIGPGTEVNLERLAGASGPGTSVLLQLVEGIIGLVAPQRSWSVFEVRTPVAIASVRSTEWLVELAPSGEAAVFVRAGVVAVRSNSGSPSSLGPGEGITVAADGAAGPVKTWRAARIAQATGAVGFGWK